MFPPFLQSLEESPTPAVAIPQERRIIQSCQPRYGSALYTKTPGEVLSFGIEYSGDLAVGDTLATSAWSATGVTLAANAINTTPVTLRRRTIPARHLAVVLIGGGALSRFYDITNVVTTADGETFERRFRLNVKNAALL